MTMTTHVRINYPLNPITVLDWLTVRCGGEPEIIRRIETERTDSRRIMNMPGSGLSALCAVEFNVDGPLPTRTEFHESDDPDWPAAIIEATFDSPYGLRTDDGLRCDEHHKSILIDMRTWLVEQGVPLDALTFGVWEFMSEWGPLADVETIHRG